MRCLIYARVSLDPRGQGRSVTEQETECRAWAAREQWTVTTVITETGSASRFAKSTGARSRWAEVTEHLQSGQVDALLVWEASRATRDLSVYTALRDLCAQTGVKYGYSGTLYDLADRSDRFRTGLDALLSEDESARTSERILRSTRARAAAGQPHGKLPYGYRREYDPTTGALVRQVPDETTAPLVREVFARIIDGHSSRQIARDFTLREVAPPRPPRAAHRYPQEWLGTTVTRIAVNPAYAGLRVHQGAVVGPAAWSGLVTADTFDTAAAIMSDPARLSRKGDSTARWLLSGIALCGRCDRPLSVLTNRGSRAYQCMHPGCMRLSRKAEPVDEFVTATLLQLIVDHRASLTASTRHPSPDVAQARADIAGLRARLDGLINQAADGSITPATLAKIEGRLIPQIAAAERRLRAMLLPSVMDGFDLTDPPASWARLTIAEQRKYVRALISVRVLPAGKGHRTFNPDLVQITPLW